MTTFVFEMTTARHFSTSLYFEQLIYMVLISLPIETCVKQLNSQYCQPVLIAIDCHCHASSKL